MGNFPCKGFFLFNVFTYFINALNHVPVKPVFDAVCILVGMLSLCLTLECMLDARTFGWLDDLLYSKTFVNKGTDKFMYIYHQTLDIHVYTSFHMTVYYTL